MILTSYHMICIYQIRKKGTQIDTWESNTYLFIWDHKATTPTCRLGRMFCKIERIWSCDLQHPVTLGVARTGSRNIEDVWKNDETCMKSGCQAWNHAAICVCGFCLSFDKTIISSKPICSIRSASSSTTKVQRRKLQPFIFTISIKRPGVAMTISLPPRFKSARSAED